MKIRFTKKVKKVKKDVGKRGKIGKKVKKVTKKRGIIKKENIIIRKSRKAGNIFIQNDECLTYATVLVLWRVGSIYEKKNEHGLSHFIEHMLFKGTKNRPNSRAVTDTIYHLGGDINAYTSREMTGYHVTLPNDKIEIGLEILSDMLNNSLLREKDVEDEKKVVIQENKKYNSSPTSYLMQNLHQTIYKNSPLSYDVGGFNKDIKHFRRSQVIKYMKKHYTKGNRLICVSGNLGKNAASIERLVEKHFGGGHSVHKQKTITKRRKSVNKRNVAVRKQINKFKNLSQAYIALAFPAYPYGDERFYALNIVGNILAGNMSSRLFMRLREKYGLVYSVHFSGVSYSDTGYVYIAAGTNNEINKIQKVVDEIYKELRNITRCGVTEEEVKQTKNYIIESMKMESNSGTIYGYGDEYLLLNKFRTRAELLRLYEKITMDDIEKTIAEIFQWNKQYLVIQTDKKCGFLKEKRKDF